ncbi:MAG TPA: PDZ domain-containing protein [Oceanospirillales bacterium]|nr:PDZ domain-containing protein [Oceanospirillales bacterium]
MGQYKNQILMVFNWLIIGLIVMLWGRFILSGNSQIALDSKASQAPIGQRQNTLHRGSIAQYHIFGSAQQLYDIPLSQGNSNLDFVLNGTMSNSNKGSGMAYISNVQGIQKKFNVGDKIFDLATLKEVHKNYVIISHNGKNERISLSENKISFDTVSRKKPAINKASAVFNSHLNGSQQRSWQEMIDQQKFDPNKISNIVSNISMVTDQSGSIQGLRVSNLAQGNLLKKHGLRSNDIITAVNGKQVSAKNMLSIKKAIMENPNTTITIKRNGKVQNIQVNLSDI